MADFSNIVTRRAAFSTATAVLDRILAVYAAAAAVRDTLALYQAGTDADLTTAINGVFSSAQRSELAQIATALAAFATDMETNHQSVLALR